MSSPTNFNLDPHHTTTTTTMLSSKNPTSPSVTSNGRAYSPLSPVSEVAERVATVNHRKRRPEDIAESTSLNVDSEYMGETVQVGEETAGGAQEQLSMNSLSPRKERRTDNVSFTVIQAGNGSEKSDTEDLKSIVAEQAKTIARLFETIAVLEQKVESLMEQAETPLEKERKKLEKALIIDPNNLFTLYELASTYRTLAFRDKNYFQKAVNMLLAALNQKPDDIWVTCELAHTYAEMGQPQKAKELLEPIYTRGDRSEILLRNLGNTYRLLDELDKAKEMLEDACGITKEFQYTNPVAVGSLAKRLPIALGWLGDTLRRLKDYDTARVILVEVQHHYLYPLSERQHYLTQGLSVHLPQHHTFDAFLVTRSLGKVKVALGDNLGAQLQFEEALKLQRQHIDTLMSLSEVYEKLQQPEKAKEMREEAALITLPMRSC